MRKGSILSGPSPHDPEVAARINGLHAIDTVSWDNSVAIHLGYMAITSQPTQSVPTAMELRFYSD